MKLLIIPITICLVWILMLLTSCGSVPPNVVQGGVATIETSICILNTWSKDKAAGRDDAQAVADCIQNCATDAATITRVIDASKAASVRAGLCQ